MSARQSVRIRMSSMLHAPYVDEADMNITIWLGIAEQHTRAHWPYT